MSHYIVCHRKSNNPRMDVRICEKKCHSKEACTEYTAYHRIIIQDKHIPLSLGPPSLGLEPAGS